MEENQKTEDFYKRLREQLEGDTHWPSEYLYKFIIPASLEKLAEIEVIFDGLGANILTRDSTKGTYTSISIRVSMKTADAVIEKYLEVSKIEGVISL